MALLYPEGFYSEERARRQGMTANRAARPTLDVLPRGEEQWGRGAIGGIGVGEGPRKGETVVPKGRGKQALISVSQATWPTSSV